MSHPVAVLAIADPSFRQRLGKTLTGLRWSVVETAGGAEALAQLEHGSSQAIILDRWLPDLDVNEFVREVQANYPEIDLISVDGSLPSVTTSRNGRRGELMHAIRTSQEFEGLPDPSHMALRLPAVPSGKRSSEDGFGVESPASSMWPDGAAVSAQRVEASLRADQRRSAIATPLPVAPRLTGVNLNEKPAVQEHEHGMMPRSVPPGITSSAASPAGHTLSAGTSAGTNATPCALAFKGAKNVSFATDIALPNLSTTNSGCSPRTAATLAVALPEFLGTHPCMLEVSRRIRLVAPRTTPVLIQGPSGSGKELVARAIHRLSPRCNRPFVVLNCAAIPESLLEAELFGHTRGAFTGAVQGRVGRIEAANGGTLFLDEIGEMPLALQSKLLRFLEAGEIQRVGDNDSIRVDVRIVAATHQPLAQRARQGSFREDVFYRLAVFVIRTPSLADHSSDVALVAATFLRRLSENSPAKSLEAAALDRLLAYSWPGNVRELAHVIERAYILAESRNVVLAQDIEFESADESHFSRAETSTYRTRKRWRYRQQFPIKPVLIRPSQRSVSRPTTK